MQTVKAAAGLLARALQGRQVPLGLELLEARQDPRASELRARLALKAGSGVHRRKQAQVWAPHPVPASEARCRPRQRLIREILLSIVRQTSSEQRAISSVLLRTSSGRIVELEPARTV